MAVSTPHDAAPAFDGAPAHDAQGRPVRVTVLSRSGCHLCDEALMVVRDVGQEVGSGWVVVDLDEAMAHADTGADLARFSDQVPVVFVDGRQVGTWRIEPETLRRALSRRGPRRLWEILHKRLG